MTPEQVVDEVEKSGLRGRGGAGFPTGRKWRLTAKEKATPKYVICNADEGDPGAFMDRSAIEGDPHTIVEGMTIGGDAVGAHHRGGYNPAGNSLALKRIHKGIEDAPAHRLPRQKNLGADFSFDIQIRLGGRRIRPPSVSSASPRGSTTSRPGPTFRSSSSTAPTGSRRSAPRPARARRCSPWPARSSTPA